MYTCWLEDIGLKDSPAVGSKNAALGELHRILKKENIPIPLGFAVTARGYWDFLAANDMVPQIKALLDALQTGENTLEKTGYAIRQLFRNARYPEKLATRILNTYRRLCCIQGIENSDVAVRSSATAEDLPDASFAGMLESFLNIKGDEQLLDACRRCYASLFTDRAISYRDKMGFDHMQVSLSIGVQQMVRSDEAGAGVMFSVDTKTGFEDLIVITAAWGLGESVVQGTVIPDEYRAYKPFLKKVHLAPVVEKTLGDKETRRVYAVDGEPGTRDVKTSKAEREHFVLNDEEIMTLARWARAIEEHFAAPMDMEWAKDGPSGILYVVQARPVTTKPVNIKDFITLDTLRDRKAPLLTGVSIGDGVVTGEVSLIESYKDIGRFRDSTILVSESANTGWIGALRKKQAKALVTDLGGRNSHAAIVSRELGIPGILSTRKATRILRPGQQITIASLEGDEGCIYDGILKYRTEKIDLQDIPETRLHMMINVASDTEALHWWQMPCDGIGLVRTDHILRHIIQVHPMALIHFNTLKVEEDREEVSMLTRAYSKKTDYFIETLSNCLAQIAATCYPKPVLVLTSNLETADYASLAGGSRFEPDKKETAYTCRGASRYLSDHYRKGFELEFLAIKRARDLCGFDNIHIIIPYCRSVSEADRVLGMLGDHNLNQGKNGLEIYLSCDCPANINYAADFASRFDGFIIASRKIRNLILNSEADGSDLDPEPLKSNNRVEAAMTRLIRILHDNGRRLHIVGEMFSRSRNLVEFLLKMGVDALSIKPESFPKIKGWVAEAEKNTYA
jgi:pyruvate,water dikinase